MQALRGLVSKKKKRYQKDGFDLDLTYITNKIIVMGYPSTGKEQVYRNPLDQVQKFFTTYHSNSFKVYNLCSEKDYPASHFETIGGQVENRIAFDDHNPPPLNYIMDFCLDAEEWLKKRPDNVVAIHCKAGKGRSGTLAVCLLLWTGVCKTATEALEFYGSMRTYNGKGVTIPSQIRFVYYFEKCLGTLGTDSPSRSVAFPSKNATVHIDKIILQTIPHFDPDKGCDPYVIIEGTHGDSITLNASKKQIEYHVTWDYRATVPKLEHFTPKKHDTVTMNINLELSGNIKFFFYDEDKLSKDDKMFSFWLHTSFLDPNSKCLRLQKSEIDRAVKDKSHKLFDATFTVEVYYSVTYPGEFATTLY